MLKISSFYLFYDGSEEKKMLIFNIFFSDNRKYN